MFSEKMRTRTSVMFLLIAVSLFVHSRAAEQTCSIYEGRIPRQNRIYTVSSKRLLWREDCESLYNARPVSEFHAYVGMNINVTCLDSIAGKIIRIYKGNQIIDNSTSHRFSNLQITDAGEYECRIEFDNGTGVASTYYNITVSAEEVAIGMSRLYCRDNFRYNSSYDCCSTDVGQRVTDMYDGYAHSGVFYAYGTKNISVRHEWVTSSDLHYHGDIGLYVDDVISSSGQFTVKLKHFPKLVNYKEVIVIAIITASNTHSVSQSICVPLFINRDEPNFTANESQPLDTYVSVGGLAKFECQFGTANPDGCNHFYIFSYYQLIENRLVSVLNHYHRCNNFVDGKTFPSNKRLGLNISILDNKPIAQISQYVFYIKAVDMKDNGSVFSCSIFSGNQIQWQQNASLIVDPVIELNTTQSMFHVGHVVSSFAAVVFVTVLCTTSICLCIWKRRKRRAQSVEADQVPLTNGFSSPNMCDSEPGSPVTAEKQLPTIQILEFHGPQQEGTNVNESCFKVQGYQNDSHGAELNSPRICNLTELTHNTSELCIGYSDSSSSNHGQTKYEAHQNCLVYISYTERKAEWVLDYLKPLIESWRYSEVILHEEDMIPGFTISGERQRLILQAHKVVLIVSKDYSESPWCLYELQHAIHKEPALCRGRIIPIMVDGCQVLPSIVRGIVPLLDSDKNFQLKLKKNIIGGWV